MYCECILAHPQHWSATSVHQTVLIKMERSLIVRLLMTLLVPNPVLSLLRVTRVSSIYHCTTDTTLCCLASMSISFSYNNCIDSQEHFNGFIGFARDINQKQKQLRDIQNRNVILDCKSV